MKWHKLKDGQTSAASCPFCFGSELAKSRTKYIAKKVNALQIRMHLRLDVDQLNSTFATLVKQMHAVGEGYYTVRHYKRDAVEIEFITCCFGGSHNLSVELLNVTALGV